MYGYLERNREANSDQIRALIDMLSLRSKKDVHKLNGRVVALRKFISNSLNKCHGFFKILKGKKDFEWMKECEKKFEELKSYLRSPPLLVKPNPMTHLCLGLCSELDISED